MLLYLKISDDWIFNALEVLHSYGFIRPPFFVYPPYPVGAHVKIVTKREAEDHELFGRDLSHLIGKSVEFEVVKAHVSYPRIKRYGIEARYKIRISSPELSEIREELTGLSSGPNNGHFVILVGLRMDEEEFEQKFSPEQKHEELDDTTPLASTKKSKPAGSSSDDDDEEETKASESITKKSKPVSSSSPSETSSSDDEEEIKPSKTSISSKSLPKKSPESVMNLKNLTLLTIIVINVALFFLRA